jgi:hypothetical protein
VRRRRLPDSARGGGPPAIGCGGRGSPTSTCGGRGSPTSTCGGGDSSIRSRGGGSQVGGGGSSIQRVSDGSALVRASGGVPGTPRRQFQGRRSSDATRCASSDGDIRGARFEQRHGRCEVRAATIAHDILRSSVVRVARLTTYICAYVIDDVLRRLPPSICVFLLLCIMPTTCIIYAKNYTILCLNTKIVYKFDACVFFACILERQFLNLCCS